ncbi:DUF4019 domain-containing protein [Sphingopyxis sp. LARHCG72]
MKNLGIFAAGLLTVMIMAAAPATASVPADRGGLPTQVSNAAAQQAAPASAAQPAQLSGDAFIRTALATVQALDGDGAGQIYDAASATMKGAISRERFIASVAENKARRGAVRLRDWLRVERMSVPTSAPGAAPSLVPPGLYVTVNLVAFGARNGVDVEQLSFRLDQDNSWRLAGVVTVTPPAQPPAPAR